MTSHIPHIPLGIKTEVVSVILYYYDTIVLKEEHYVNEVQSQERYLRFNTKELSGIYQQRYDVYIMSYMWSIIDMKSFGGGLMVIRIYIPI